MTTTQKGSAVGSGIEGNHGSKPVVIDDGRRLNIGVEIFTVDPGIITPEKRKSGKIDNSGVSNTGIQDQLNAQNSTKSAKRKIKVPSNTASKVLRDTESSYLAVKLKKLLDKTGKYGMVHTIPASKVKGKKALLSSIAYDYLIRTTILKSDGNRVEFKVRCHSSINGFKKPVKLTLSADIPRSAYVGKKSAVTGKMILKYDPYDVVLKKIVSIFNEKVKKKQTKYPVKKHQELTLARYGHFNAPEAFKDYPIKKNGVRGYVVNPAPDPANPNVSNVIKMHRTELMAIDRFEEHYKEAAKHVEGPYILWRKETRDALIAYEYLKNETDKVKQAVIARILLEKTVPILVSILNGRNTSRSLAITVLITFLAELKKSMIETDGYITVVKLPNLETYAKSNRMYELADLLDGYSEQMIAQAVAVESLKEEFTTLSKPITLETTTSSKTYYGKLDEVFRQYKEDLRKDYRKKTGFATANNNKSGKTADNEDERQVTNPKDEKNAVNVQKQKVTQ